MTHRMTPEAAAALAASEGTPVLHQLDGEPAVEQLTIPPSLVEAGVRCEECGSCVVGGDGLDLDHVPACYLGELLAAERDADVQALEALRLYRLPLRRHRSTTEAEAVVHPHPAVQLGTPVVVEPGPDGQGRQRWWPTAETS